MIKLTLKFKIFLILSVILGLIKEFLVKSIVVFKSNHIFKTLNLIKTVLFLYSTVDVSQNFVSLFYTKKL